MAIRTGNTADGQADEQPYRSTSECMGQSQRRIHRFAAWAWALGRADRRAEMVCRAGRMRVFIDGQASTRLDARGGRCGRPAAAMPALRPAGSFGCCAVMSPGISRAVQAASMRPNPSTPTLKLES
eukprot:214446-Chlamydomonas_euryale.AAC.1